MRADRAIAAVLALLLSLAGLGAPAGAAAPGPATAAALYVALVVDGVEDPSLVRVRDAAGHLWIDIAALRAAGIALAGEGQVDIAACPGVTATLDHENQRLLLDVAPALLPTRRLSGDRPGWTRPTIAAGALVNYDLYVQTSGGETTASLWSEQRVFGPLGMLANTGIVRVGGAVAGGYIRYDTSYRFLDEARALKVTAGDLVTGALAWTTPVRAGGVQIARSFATRPDLVTVPLPAFAGQAAVPSGVDLFVNGYRQQHDDVVPGRFVLDGVPVVNGAGEARVVTTDAVGRQVATVIPFYVAPELLRAGLSDFSIDAGALRRGYGIRSFAYGRAIAAGSLRHGVSDHLTIEGHGEVARDLALAGIGLVWSPGLVGAVHGAVAASRRDGIGGTRATIGYNYVGRSFGIGIERTAYSRGFADLASFDLATWTGRRHSLAATVTTRIAALGSVGLGLIEARTRDGSRARLASASVSLPIGRRLSLFAAGDYDLARRTVTAQLRLVLPIGRALVASAGATREAGGSTRFEADAARAMPAAGGLGWSASAASGGAEGFVGQASATYRGHDLAMEAGGARARNTSSAWGGVSGAVVLLGGHAHAANQLPDAFAVVETGMAGVPVYYENQPAGRTGRDGTLFVPHVVAYHPAQFAIDIAELPTAATAAMLSAQVALREGTGGLIRLPVELTRSATVTLLGTDGRPIAPGTPIALSDGSRTIAGWDGVVLIARLAGPIRLRAQLPGGAGCTATVTPPARSEPVANLGVLTCG